MFLQISIVRLAARAGSHSPSYNGVNGLRTRKAIQPYRCLSVVMSAVEPEEDEDENLAPNVSGGGFSFGNMAAQQQQQPAFAF